MRTCLAAVLLVIVLAAPAIAEGPAPRDLADPSRAALEVPEELWERVLAVPAPARRPLGYTGDEMRNYGGREHLLRSVENLFRDIRTVPRTTGRIAEELIKAGRAGNPADLLQWGWGLTDIPSGRMLEGPKAGGWGLPGIATDAPLADVLRLLLEVIGPGDQAAAIREFGEFPGGVQRFILRLAIARRLALPWLVQSIEFPADDPDGAGVRRSLAAPWTDEENGQSATRDGRCFRWMREVDRAPLAYGAVVFAVHLRGALAEFQGWLEAGGREELSKVGACDWRGLPGMRVLGTGDDEIRGSQPSIVVDLGGRDRWLGRVGVSNGPADPLSVVIDVAGDDVYDAGEESFALGCGVFGLGAVVDLGGDDRYTVGNSGLGCAWFGTGLVWDAAGNDVYTVKGQWGQGAAHIGVGLLADLGGNDRYECAQQSQGMGSTLGCGILLDLAGNDVYHCRDDGNVSAMYLNQSVAMAQGCGFGRRADIGDGRSLAGGWGLLVDAAGDDRYHAQCWSQGCGYWWGIGVLEDHAGNDVYENGKYSLGAGAHYAIGVQVDLSGDDRYNIGVLTTKNQFQGHARDGSFGVSLDGDGDDRYALKNMCGGSADLGSMALFWDRRGNDSYEGAMEDGLGAPPPLGSATVYPRFRAFRDDLPAVGVFLDTGGRDAYSGDPRGEAGARDGEFWRESRGAMSFGVGIDTDLYR